MLLFFWVTINHELTTLNYVKYDDFIINILKGK